MSNLLQNLPLVNYRDNIMSNLMVSAQLVRETLTKFDVFFPYSVKEKERADMIAFDYYNDSKMDWLIYVTNNIYDPYYGWVLDDKQLVQFIVNKYGSIENATQNILFYRYVPVYGDNMLDISNKTYTMSILTFNTLTTNERVGWEPVTPYQYEQEENEKKRNIRLISNQFVGQINEEMLRLFG